MAKFGAKADLAQHSPQMQVEFTLFYFIIGILPPGRPARGKCKSLKVNGNSARIDSKSESNSVS
jgi:hypothetical protein